MKSYIHRTYSFVLLSMLIALCSGGFGPGRLLWGQTGGNSGQIVGQVLDASSAAVSGAEISVRNKETNFARSTATDSAGRFAVSLLPLGNYEVTAKAANLEPALQDVEVTLGSSISANFKLNVGAAHETIQVTGAISTVEPTVAPSKSILTELQIRKLPSNGGRVQNLVWQTPGAQVEPECRNLSISGQKGIFENVNVDGADYVSSFACATGSIRGGSGAAPTLNLDALQEFQITRNIFTAEFGRTTGGIINMSTKSGTNLFHGSAFYNFRNAELTALDPFGNQAVGRNQQVGGTFGGPITQDRTFFFIAPEIQVAHKPVKILYSVLDTQGVRSTPAAQALLGAAPEGSTVAMDNSQSLITRFDHRLSDTNSFFGRFDFTHTAGTSLTGSNAQMTGPSLSAVTTSALSNQTVVDVYSGTLMGQLTTALSSSRLNELRLQMGREDRPRTPQGAGPQVVVQNNGAVISTYGPQATGVSFGNGQFPEVDNRYQAADNFSIVSGAHSFKLGFDFLRIAGNVTFSPGQNGAYTFTSLDSYLARQPFSYQQFTGSGAAKLAINEVGFFAQDEWRVLPRVTISPGMRYEAQINPDYLAATAPASRAPQATSIPSALKEFEPRMGVAWDLKGDGKTVVRAGGGIYYAASMMSNFVQSLLFNGGNPERGLGYVAASTNPTVVSNAFAAAGIDLAHAPLNNLPVLTAQQYQTYIQNPTTGLSVYYMDPNFQNPRALQWKAGLDQEIARNVVAAVDFTYVNTAHVSREIDRNLPAPVADATGRLVYGSPLASARPLAPRFFNVLATESSAREMYRAITASLNVRRRRFVMSAYYTLGFNLSMTDTERPVNNVVYDSAANLKNDYNWSNLDMRHQFTATNVVTLPYGFELTGTQRFLSGRPFSATAGTDLNQDGQNVDRPLLNGSVIKRNTYRNQAFYGVDMGVRRTFAMAGEKRKVIVSADMFNLFNFGNVLLAGPALTYGNAGTVIQNGSRVTLPPAAAFQQLRNSAGKYIQSNSPGDPFQAQFGVRFEF